MKSSTPLRDRPWSHRQSTLVRLLLCAFAGLGSGLVGTLAHRMGAMNNLPYGLVLALLLVALSTWAARLRSGAIGVACHLVACWMSVWLLATWGPGGDVLTPIGFGGKVPFFSQYAGTAWLLGVVMVSLTVLIAPRRWMYGTPTKAKPGNAQ